MGILFLINQHIELERVWILITDALIVIYNSDIENIFIVKVSIQIIVII